MKNFWHIVLFSTIVYPALSCFILNAQMPSRNLNQVQIKGWSDDTHFLLQKPDEDGKSVTARVDIKTSREVTVVSERPGRDLLTESLPDGEILGSDDIISQDAKSAVLVKDNDIYYFRKGEKKLVRLTQDDQPEVNVTFSPDSRKIAYTKSKDLYVLDLDRGAEKRLTFDASGKIYNGYSSWVYMEEILGRQSHYAAFWFSPDGNKIAFLRTDESDVPVFTLNRLDEPDGIHGLLEQVPYPKAGDPNPKVKMGIADIASGEITWIKTDYSVDQYIAWPFWTPDSKNIAVQVLNRDQNRLDIFLADPATGDYKIIYTEGTKTWVEFFEDVYVMKNGSGFILRSYRSGWENLYLYGWDGTLKSQITDFEWRVEKIERVDEAAGIVYFSGTGPESTDNHFFRIGIDGKNPLQITSGTGTHEVSISPLGNYFIDTWSNIKTPGAIVACDKKGILIREVHNFGQPLYDPSKDQRAELFRIKTSDGLFEMPAIITYPLNFNAMKKYPVVFTIYGGPNSKNISSNRWKGTSPDWYARNGIITLTVDHRGSGHFGKKGLDYLYRSLGKWEILDYEDAVRWLLDKPFIDKSRIGITGSSYGGYLTCLALTKGADFWTHGFAGSSVTDYRLYDNIYTERFMDTPSVNPQGYKDGSALTWAKMYKGKLYMTHGDMDDNVHMQNSIYLISRLQDEGKSFQFMIYPGGRHGWGGNKALHSRNEAYKFWMTNFFGHE